MNRNLDFFFANSRMTKFSQYNLVGLWEISRVSPWGLRQPWAGWRVGLARHWPHRGTCTRGWPSCPRSGCPWARRQGASRTPRGTASGSRWSTRPVPSCGTWWTRPRMPGCSRWMPRSEAAGRIRSADWCGGCSSAGSTAAKRSPSRLHRLLHQTGESAKKTMRKINFLSVGVRSSMREVIGVKFLLTPFA